VTLIPITAIRRSPTSLRLFRKHRPREQTSCSPLRLQQQPELPVLPVDAGRSAGPAGPGTTDDLDYLADDTYDIAAFKARVGKP
jgi:hypothetical protein